MAYYKFSWHMNVNEYNVFYITRIETSFKLIYRMVGKMSSSIFLRIINGLCKRYLDWTILTRHYMSATCCNDNTSKNLVHKHNRNYQYKIQTTGCVKILSHTSIYLPTSSVSESTKQGGGKFMKLSRYWNRRRISGSLLI